MRIASNMRGALIALGSMLALVAGGVSASEKNVVIGELVEIEANPAHGFGRSILVQGVQTGSQDAAKLAAVVPEGATLGSEEGQPVTFESLKVGQRVQVEFESAEPEPRVVLFNVKTLTVLAAPKAGEFVTMIGDVRKAGSWEDPDISSEADEVVFRNQERRGVLLRKWATYLVKVRPERVQKFTEAGFESIKDFRLTFRWNRVSNINGYGTDVNGEVHRAWKDEQRFKDADVAAGLATTRAYLEDWLAETRARNADAVDHVWTDKSVALFERGFKVTFSMSLEIFSVKDSKFVSRLSWGRQSGYYSL